MTGRTAPVVLIETFSSPQRAARATDPFRVIKTWRASPHGSFNSSAPLQASLLVLYFGPVYPRIRGAVTRKNSFIKNNQGRG